MLDQVLRIGILADSSLQQHLIRKVVEEFGYQVCACRLIEQLTSQNTTNHPGNIDAWVVDVDLTSLEHEVVENWLDNVTAPVIFGDGVVMRPGSEEFLAWSRRLRIKLQQLVGSINLEREHGEIARDIWVLAASTGGPKAVNQFLCALPAKLNIGFVYVQHINVEFDKTLAQIIAKGSHYTAKIARHGDVICKNEVIVVATDKCVEVQGNGTLTISDKYWSGPYRPSVNEVVANVAYTFGSHSGAIVFTGMGDDGATSARLMHQQGGEVWVQTPESCTSTSMPLSVLATECASFSGTPEALAARLTRFVTDKSDGNTATMNFTGQVNTL